MKRKLVSLYVRLMVHPGYRTTKRIIREILRRLTFRKHDIKVFLQLDDPYSYLLSHYLQRVSSSYKVELRVYLSQALRGDFAPEPAMASEYAVRDCKLLARELGIPFLDIGSAPAVEHRRALLHFLAEEQVTDDFSETFHAALSHYWRGDIEAAARLMGRIDPDKSETNVLVAKNQLLLRKLGHYNSAMMLYGGEWYWGVDRLPYLCTRLDRLGARKSKEPVSEISSLRQAMQPNLPAAVPRSAGDLPTIELYFSFRSPYSYLSLQRSFDIADAFGTTIVVRPVLPMVQRGMKVPRQKLLYIVKDAAREAERLNLPFGHFADPVGQGAERCIAVFYYAAEQGKAREFLLSASQAIWSEGMDVATDDGMRIVTERAGLFWPDVLQSIADESWRETAAASRDAMTDVGLWGVPSYIAGEIVMWGQDRAWLLTRQFEDLCHDGDGILV